MRSSRGSSLLARLLAVLALLGLVWVGCVSDNEVVAPQGSNNSKAGSPNDVLDASSPRVQAIMAVQDRHTPELMSVQDVVGTATGLGPDGQLVIYVFTAGPTEYGTLPAELEGVPVIEEVTGPFRAFAVSHKTKQTPPIQLGTSGGWRYDLANGYCCGGTLGSLVKVGTTQYVLSNYHVLEADIVSGGNSRVAATGDPVIQPGLIDVNCSATSAQNVATLLLKKSLPNNNVDCAIAQVTSGMVRTDGAILEIGTLSASTVAASINQAVKKSGRTTGLTRSTVSGLNATISVQYENECAGGVAFTKTFTGQIVIKNRLSRFLAGGDSGSLLVQDVTTNPKAVGLLFAGSSTQAIANPINSVLSFLGATMVGQ